MLLRSTGPIFLIVLPCLTLIHSQEMNSASMGSMMESLKDKLIHAIEPSDSDAFSKLVNGPNPTNGPPSTSIQENDPSSGITTVGIVVEIEKLLLPLTELFLLFLDSLLRNAIKKSLPCTITSWIPLEGTCTPLDSSAMRTKSISMI